MAAARGGASQAARRSQQGRAKESTLDTDGYVGQVEGGSALQSDGNDDEDGAGASNSACGVSGLERLGERPVP